jgi:hypothetical protein
MLQPNLLSVLAQLAVFALALAQPPGTISPLAQTCGPTSSIVCINKYASVMPYHFFREPSYNGSYEDTYPSTLVPNDTSWSLVGKADFLVFDQARGLALLGATPNYEYMFAVNDGTFEQQDDACSLFTGELNVDWIASCARSTRLLPSHKQALLLPASWKYVSTRFSATARC